MSDELHAARERLRGKIDRLEVTWGPNHADAYRLARAYLADDWQPIETAPKDGTLFLAYAAPGQHELPELYALCRWDEGAGFCIDELREPTHWTRLPAPPATHPGDGR